MKTPEILPLALLFLTLLMNNGCTSSMAEYQAIVDHLKTQDLKDNQLYQGKIQNFGEPTSVELSINGRKTNRGEGKGLVWVHQTADDFLVFIETEDKGHAGEYGYAYSESGNPPDWNHDEWGEFWTIGEQVNEHWWRISYRLD